MASRIVTSPAGEDVEIIPDEEWMIRTGSGPGGLRQWFSSKGGKPYIIAELWLGGEFNNRSGQATKELYEAMQERFPDVEFGEPNSVTMLMNTPINAPAFERNINGKRCYSIRLAAMPETWYRKLLAFIEEQGLEEPADLGEPIPVDPITKEPLKDEDMTTEAVDIGDLDAEWKDLDLDAPTVFDVKPPLELSVASQVAMSLLTTVVEIISAGSSETVDERVRKLQDDLNDVAGKLSLRLSENDTLRRQLRESGDMIIALRTERDGLRSRLRATESNLQAALKGDAVHAINGEIMRRVDSIMRVAPTTKKGDDG